MIPHPISEPVGPDDGVPWEVAVALNELTIRDDFTRVWPSPAQVARRLRDLGLLASVSAHEAKR